MQSFTPDTALTAYLTWIADQPISAHTRRAYSTRVSQFCHFLLAGNSTTYGDPLYYPNARDYAVRDFKTYLKTHKHAKPASVNLTLAALDHFYRFLGVERPQVLRENLEQAAPQALSLADQKHFLRIVKSEANTRDRAIALLLFYTGIRLSECTSLNLDDVLLSQRKGTVIVRAGKGNTYREVPLNTQVREALEAWVKERATKHPVTSEKAFFLSPSHQRLTARAVDLRLRKLARSAGLTFSAHTLRHTCLTNLVRGGNDLVLVAEIAGHKRLETTRRYSLPSAQDRELAMQALELEY